MDELMYRIAQTVLTAANAEIRDITFRQGHRDWECETQTGEGSTLLIRVRPADGDGAVRWFQVRLSEVE